MNQIPDFRSLQFDRPSEASLAEEYRVIGALLDGHDLPAAIAAFDATRRRFDSWASHVHLTFSQNTADEDAKAERDYADRLGPIATDHEVELSRYL